MSSKGAAGGLGPAPAGDNQKTLERRRSHFYNPATLWHSEVRNGEYNTMKRCLLSTPILKNWFGSFAVLIVWIFMILGLGMSQAGRDKNTNWKFYFIYRKCRVNPFLKSMTSREAGQGGEGRTARDTRSLRYTVTLSRCSYTGTLLHFCYTALAHCYTGPGLWTTAGADWNLGVESGGAWAGPQYNTLQLGYPGNGEIIQNNTIGPEYKEAWGEYKTSWTAHWDHSLLFVASSFLWLSILNKNKKVEGQTTYLLRIIYISCSCLSVFRDYPNHCVFDTNRIINYLLCIYILFCSLRFLMDYISI